MRSGAKIDDSKAEGIASLADIFEQGTGQENHKQGAWIEVK